MKGKHGSEPSCIFCRKVKMGQGSSLQLASLNNVSRLWAIRMVSNCLALGVYGRGHIGLVYKLHKGGDWGYALRIGGRVYNMISCAHESWIAGDL